MSIIINGNQQPEGLVLDIKPSNMKGMEPFILKESISKIQKILDLGIDTFNPNCITVRKGEASLRTKLEENTILIVESPQFVCMGNFHKKQMRQGASSIFKKIFEYFEYTGPLKVTVVMNENTWSINIFCATLFKNLQSINHYKVIEAPIGAEIVVY